MLGDRGEQGDDDGDVVEATSGVDGQRHCGGQVPLGDGGPQGDHRVPAAGWSNHARLPLRHVVAQHLGEPLFKLRLRRLGLGKVCKRIGQGLPRHVLERPEVTCTAKPREHGGLGGQLRPQRRERPAAAPAERRLPQRCHRRSSRHHATSWRGLLVHRRSAAAAPRPSCLPCDATLSACRAEPVRVTAGGQAPAVPMMSLGWNLTRRGLRSSPASAAQHPKRGAGEFRSVMLHGGTTIHRRTSLQGT